MASSADASCGAAAAAAATGGSSLRRVPVLLLGCGNVAQALLAQIKATSELHAVRYGLRFDVAGIADSTGFVLAQSNGDAPAALTPAELAAAVALKVAKKTLSAHPLGHAGSGAQLVAEVTSRMRCVVVDASAADGTGAILLQALERGSAAVTANKKPMADRQSIWDGLHAPAHRHRLRYECTVGAATPFVAAVARVVASGDPVRKAVGSFSGTLGFVVSALEAGVPYSEAVRDAVQRGYTEPDPRDDLGGVDVARKALILARMLGRQDELADVHVEPLYDAAAHAALPVPAFLAALASQDQLYADKVAAARSSGQCLRYVASIDPAGGPITVGLQALPSDSSLSCLQGTGNLLELHTDLYSPQPLVVQGAGAGGQVTAAGILADMIEVANSV